MSGDTCAVISEANGLDLADLFFLNPSLNAKCTNILLELAYCVAPVGDITTYTGYPISSILSGPLGDHHGAARELYSRQHSHHNTKRRSGICGNNHPASADSKWNNPGVLPVQKLQPESFGCELVRLRRLLLWQYS
ncbi:hypothetical protein QBC38DRAFT_504196 [Podospora fimiseda]|uniref:LysM domain-containing protein n=1 Tax=Podospora fimiseda TaxID=252190 RepID=A0AAN6YP01_9PEZI|nr:hypothetical protein QBC38DRAFT_504196 [Podospora fimiseda]